jgi:hypothetical protein
VQQVDIGALMLEDVTHTVTGTEGMTNSATTYDPAHLQNSPRRFVDTREFTEAQLAVCEDTDGREFRPRAWEYECVQLCGDGYGYGGACSSSDATRQCYWKTEFAITQTAIEAGRMIRAGGFAFGNYNYRIESLGVNVVGSAARECADDALPSTCFSAGYVPYSLDHRGPYTVRNHRGELYEAPLFVGHIEHARALAAERYITNPLSSADRALMEPYQRRELRGRPLDGNYVLRIWDIPGVNFRGIEDVQIVLNYRYWTRFE